MERVPSSVVGNCLSESEAGFVDTKAMVLGAAALLVEGSKCWRLVWKLWRTVGVRLRSLASVCHCRRNGSCAVCCALLVQGVCVRMSFGDICSLSVPRVVSRIGNLE